MENFGKKSTDKVTGFTGVITAKALYMYGCSQYLLTPKVDKDGKRLDGEWFDEGRLEIFEQGITPESLMVKEDCCEPRELPWG